MSVRSDVLLIARREFGDRIRQRSFFIAAAVSIIASIVLLLFPKFSGAMDYSVGVVGPRSSAVARQLATIAKEGHYDLHIVSYPDDAAAQRGVDAGTVSAAIAEDPRTLLARSTLPDTLTALVTTDRQAILFQQSVQQSHVELPAVGDYSARVSYSHLEPNDDDRSRLADYFVLILVLGEVLTYSVWIANGVATEKLSRIVEIMLVKMPVRRLLAGKIVGLGALGGLQLIGVLGAIVIGFASGAIDFGELSGRAFAGFLISFATAFGLFATIAAACASTVTEQSQVSNSVNPLTAVFGLSTIIGASAIAHPTTPALKILSFIPPTTLTVAPIRWASHEMSTGAYLLSIAITVATAAGAIAVAGRIYERSMLRFRDRPTFGVLVREAFTRTGPTGGTVG